MMKAAPPWTAEADDEDASDEIIGADYDQGLDELDDDSSEDDDEDFNYSKIAKQTKFEAICRKIATDEGMPKAEAMTQARLRHPDLYQGFVGIKDVAKSAPQLIQQEIQKYGISPEAAAHRVALLHPEATHQQDQIAKGNSAVVEFNDMVTRIMKRDGVERTVAMRTARLEADGIWKRFQEV